MSARLQGAGCRGAPGPTRPRPRKRPEARGRAAVCSGKGVAAAGVARLALDRSEAGSPTTSRLVIHGAARVEMERRVCDGREPSRPAARRLGLFDGLSAPGLGPSVGICELGEREALTDAAAELGGHGFELFEPRVAARRLPHLVLEPAMTQLPLAARLIESDRHQGLYSAVQQPESGQRLSSSPRMRSPSS